MLSSWKEIAHFFGKGVRTVQRWEKTLDLPVRRPPNAPSNVVLARTSDLEAWMHRSAGLKAQADSESEGELVHAVSDLEVEVRHITGTPQHSGSNPSDEDVVERIQTMTGDLRAMHEEGSREKLRKVA